MRAVVLLPLAVLLSGCAGGEETATPAPPARTELVVEVRADADVAPSTLTLTCEPPGGEHPTPVEACADLAAEAEPFAPVPQDSLCAEVFGGPQTATVRGTYRGQPVTLELSRSDGCTTAQWDRLGRFLPPVVTAS